MLNLNNKQYDRQTLKDNIYDVNFLVLLKKSNFRQTPQLTSGTFFNIDTPVFI